MLNKEVVEKLIVKFFLDVKSVFMLNGVQVTSSAAELNALTGITATVDELNTTDLSAVGALVKVKKLAITATPTGAEQDTGWDLPAKGVLLDVLVDVTTQEATGADKTLDIGLKSTEAGGDADGFVDGLSVASAGLLRPGVTQVAGATETYVGSWVRGLLLLNGVPLAGTNTAGDEGVYYEKPHMTGSVTAKSVTYTAKSADWAEFRGSIYLVYIEIG